MKSDDINYKLFTIKNNGFTKTRNNSSNHKHLYFKNDKKDVLVGGISFDQNNPKKILEMTINYPNDKMKDKEYFVSDKKYFIAFLNFLSEIKKNQSGKIKVEIDESNYEFFKLLTEHLPLAVENHSYETDSFNLNLEKISNQDLDEAISKFQEKINKNPRRKVEFENQNTINIGTQK